MLWFLVAESFWVFTLAQTYLENPAERSDLRTTTAVGLVVAALLVPAVLLGERRTARRRAAAVRAACPGAVVMACDLDSGFHVLAERLGGAMLWQTSRRPTARGVLAVDAYTATLWWGTPAGLLGFVPVQYIESVASGRGRSGLFRTAPALVFSVRVSETAVLDLPVVLVRWWGPFPRSWRPDDLDALVGRVRLRLAAGRAGALPPAA
jgi:hypothetical protein